MKSIVKCFLQEEETQLVKVPNDFISKEKIAKAELDLLHCSGTPNNPLREEDDYDDLVELIVEMLWDELVDHLSLDDYEPKARYYLKEEYSVVETLLSEKLKHDFSDCIVTLEFVENDKSQRCIPIDLNYILEKYVEDRECDCQGDFDTGIALLKGMEKFISCSSWYCRVINGKPLMWFGMRNDRPEDGWVLNMEENPEEGTSWRDFWFNDDGWNEWQNRVPDAGSGFLINMTAEIGEFPPELEPVLRNCPIEVKENDTYDSLSEKISQYINKEKREE